MVPNLSESASVAGDGRIHITITNLSISEDYEIESSLLGREIKGVKAEIVTGSMGDHNTFENKDCVKTVPFDAVRAEQDKLTYVIPACSVLHIEAEV